MFSAKEVEKLIEQAYLNGSSAAAISYMRTKSFTADLDYKKSTAYYEYTQKLKKEDTK
jgi:hypothetical protein